MTSEIVAAVEKILSEVRRAEWYTPAIRALRKRVSKQLADLDRAGLLQIAHELIRRAPYGRFIAYELVHYHSTAMQLITAAEVEALGSGIDDWAHVDTFAVYVAGPAWRNNRIPDAVVRRWAKSNDRWWRRAALVSTVALNLVGGVDSQRTFSQCGMLMSDHDDMIVKAMSWALRALAKHAPDEVSQFLEDHRQELAPRVIREVTK